MATRGQRAGHKAEAIPSWAQAALLCSCSILHAWCTLAQKHHPHFQILEGGELFFPLFGCPSPVRVWRKMDVCQGEWCSGWAPRFWSKTPGVKPCLYSWKRCRTLSNLAASSFITQRPSLQSCSKEILCQALCTAWCPGIQLLLFTRQDCGTDLGSCERGGLCLLP